MTPGPSLTEASGDTCFTLSPGRTTRIAVEVDASESTSILTMVLLSDDDNVLNQLVHGFTGKVLGAFEKAIEEISRQESSKFKQVIGEKAFAMTITTS